MLRCSREDGNYEKFTKAYSRVVNECWRAFSADTDVGT